MNNNEMNNVMGGNLVAHNNASKKSSSKKSVSKTAIIAIVAVIVVLGAAVAVVVMDPFHWFTKSDGGQVEETGTNAPANLEMTEDEIAMTKKVLDEYAEVKIGGVEQVEDEHGTNDAVSVTVKNIGQDKANIAVDIVAKDNDGNVLDVASLYAEGIEPEQTQVFYVFELSELTGDQLRSAKYEIHKAYTYDTGGGQSEENAEEASATNE